MTRDERPSPVPADFLESELRQLPAGIEPPRDLWPAIAARLGEERQARTRYPWPLTAAAAVLLVAASSLVTATLLRGRQQAVNLAAPASVPGTVQVMPAAFGPGYTLDKDYVAARRELASLLQARMERMPPSTRQKLTANLAELRRAADEINAALIEQPGDPLLEELLLNTYQDELAVLASVNQLTNPGEGAGPRTDDVQRIQL